MAWLRQSDLLPRDFPLRRGRARQPRFLALNPGFRPLASSGYTTRQVHQLERYPYCSLGVLVAADTGTTTTAWLVGPDRILTAAHALRSGQVFYFGLQFTEKGGAIWSRVVRAQVPAAWLDSRDYRCDTAHCWLDRSYAATPCPPRPLPAQLPDRCLVLGYSFGTGTLWQSHGRELRWGRDRSQVSTNLSEGSSGGPWLIRDEAGYLPVGLTSRGGEGFLLSPSWRAWKALLNL